MHTGKKTIHLPEPITHLGLHAESAQLAGRSKIIERRIVKRNKDRNCRRNIILHRYVHNRHSPRHSIGLQQQRMVIAPNARIRVKCLPGVVQGIFPITGFYIPINRSHEKYAQQKQQQSYLHKRLINFCLHRQTGSMRPPNSEKDRLETETWSCVLFLNGGPRNSPLTKTDSSPTLQT